MSGVPRLPAIFSPSACRLAVAACAFFVPLPLHRAQAQEPVGARAAPASAPIINWAAAPSSTIDNSSLLPRVLPDDQVAMEGMTPDWVKTLIMAELRIETATPQGTFASAGALLNHYAEMGVNGLWICPIWQRGSKNNGYGNDGCDAIEAQLTGTREPEASLQVVKNFVEEAHRKNIRLLFDIVVWGTRTDSPLVRRHPEFYARESTGGFSKAFGGYRFDWRSPGLRQWYRDAAVNFVLKTGADGFRVDLAPDSSGYFFHEIRDALYARGHKIVLMSEIGNERKDTFDFEETGVDGWTERPDYKHPDNFRQQREKFGEHNTYLLRANLVDVVKTGRGIGEPALQAQGQGGTFRFYTSNLLTHDDSQPFVQGDRVRFGYPAIFAPFIPIWWIGEEWNNPSDPLTGDQNTGVMYFNSINADLCQTGANRDFYQDVKKFIRIRRAFPDIFQAFPASTRQANIVKVDSSKDGVPNNLQAYARFASGRAILVIPNYGGRSGTAEFKIRPPYDVLGFDAAAPRTVTDLLTGQVLSHGRVENSATLKTRIQAEHLGLYLLEKE